MEFNIEIRKKQLENLDQLISSSRKRIQSVLNYLGWSDENVLKDNDLVQCPVNPHHRICPKSWTEHIEKCVVKLEGYDLKSQFLSESTDDPTKSIYLDRNAKINIITKELSEKGPLRLAWNGLDPDPRTSDRFMSTYSPDERLCFYDYVVANTKAPSPPPEFSTISTKKEEDKQLTYEQILSQQRDLKRRRTKYKSVHINRKNHTEVIREVIDGQMEEYKDWVTSQKRPNTPPECNRNNGVYEDNKEENDERAHSSVSRNSNHSSSSRSTNRKNDHHGDKDSNKDRTYKNDSSRHRRSSSYRSNGRRRNENRRHSRSRSRERRRSRDKYRENRDRRR